MVALLLDTTREHYTLGLMTTGHMGVRTLEGVKNSEHLHSAFMDLLKEANVTAQNVQHIVLCRGPGSFTGARVGFAFSEGFKAALPHIHITAVSTLYALFLSAVEEAQSRGLPKITTTVSAMKNAFSETRDVAGNVLREAAWEESNIPAESNTLLVGDIERAWQPSPEQLMKTLGRLAGSTQDLLEPLYLKPLTYRKLRDE